MHNIGFHFARFMDRSFEVSEKATLMNIDKKIAELLPLICAAIQTKELTFTNSPTFDASGANISHGIHVQQPSDTKSRKNAYIMFQHQCKDFLMELKSGWKENPTLQKTQITWLSRTDLNALQIQILKFLIKHFPIKGSSIRLETTPSTLYQLKGGKREMTRFFLFVMSSSPLFCKSTSAKSLAAIIQVIPVELCFLITREFDIKTILNLAFTCRAAQAAFDESINSPF